MTPVLIFYILAVIILLAACIYGTSMILALVFYILGTIVLLVACINAACCLYKDINNTVIDIENKALSIIGDMFIIITSIVFGILVISKIIGVFS